MRWKVELLPFTQRRGKEGLRSVYVSVIVSCLSLSLCMCGGEGGGDACKAESQVGVINESNNGVHARGVFIGIMGRASGRVARTRLQALTHWAKV